MPNDVRLRITADDAGVIKVYGNIEAASKKAAKAVADDNEATGKSHERLQGFLSKTGEGLKKVGELSIAATAAVGGVIYESVKSSGELQTQTVQLQNALRRTGQYSQKTYTGMVNQAQMAATKGGYAIAEQTQALSQFVRVTQSHTKAQQLNTLAMNVARGSGQDYLKVVQAISMAQEGKTTQLTRLGLGVKSNASPQQAMAQLQARFGGAMNVYSNTAAGSMSNLSQSFNMVKEDLGKAFLPLVVGISRSLSKAMPMIESALSKITVPLSALLSKLLPPLVMVISKLVPPLLNGLSAFVGPLAKALSAILPPVTQAIKAILPPLTTALGEIVTALVPPLARVLSAFVPVVARMISVLAPVLTKVIDSLIPPLIKIIGALAPVMTQMVNALAPVIVKLIDALVPPLVKMITSLQPVIVQLTSSFVKLAVPLTNALVKLMPLITVLANAIASVTGVVAKIDHSVMGKGMHLALGAEHAAGHFLGHLFHKGGLVKAFAAGGLVPGVGNTDTVPAMLTPGEFVLNKQAVQDQGVSNLNTMNTRMAAGPSAGGQLPIQITVPVYLGQRIVTESVVQTLAKQNAATGAWGV